MIRIYIMTNKKDNVCTAVQNLSKNDIIHVQEIDRDIVLQEDIEFGHKFAIEDIQEGSPVIKYGEIIGTARRAILRGEHVHVHNVISSFEKEGHF